MAEAQPVLTGLSLCLILRRDNTARESTELSVSMPVYCPGAEPVLAVMPDGQRLSLLSCVSR